MKSAKILFRNRLLENDCRRSLKATRSVTGCTVFFFFFLWTKLMYRKLLISVSLEYIYYIYISISFKEFKVNSCRRRPQSRIVHRLIREIQMHLFNTEHNEQRITSVTTFGRDDVAENFQTRYEYSTCGGGGWGAGWPLCSDDLVKMGCSICFSLSKEKCLTVLGHLFIPRLIERNSQDKYRRRTFAFEYIRVLAGAQCMLSCVLPRLGDYVRNRVRFRRTTGRLPDGVGNGVSCVRKKKKINKNLFCRSRARPHALFRFVLRLI